MQPSYLSQDVPGLEGPDYVALVIEWNDDDVVTLVTSERADERPHTSAIRTIAAVLGALGALMLAAWGIRRLRTA